MTDRDLLEVRDLRISFATERGAANVLDGVNLTMRRGAITGLVGESGCGKTTLARSILGILPSNARNDGGTIHFDGQDILAMDRTLFDRDIKGRRIAFVPQDPYGAFNPLFTIGDQIMELMKWKSPLREPSEASRRSLFKRYPRERRKADREAALAMLSDVQIPQPERAFGKLPEAFSGGQRQRLMIAMAMMTKPDLIIADEPTTALDVTIQAQILKLLKRLARDRGVSVLLTTHDMGTAYEICDDITVMYAGQEVETAPIGPFFERPRHPYTAKLLASLPRAGVEIREIGGEIPSLLKAPSGCRFHPRCDRATGECSASRPAPEGSSHMVRCFHPLTEPAGAEA